MNILGEFDVHLAVLLVPFSMVFYMHMLNNVSGWVYKIFASIGVWAVILASGYWFTIYFMFRMLEVDFLTSIGTNNTISISATLGLLLSLPLKGYLIYNDRKN